MLKKTIKNKNCLIKLKSKLSIFISVYNQKTVLQILIRKNNMNKKIKKCKKLLIEK